MSELRFVAPDLRRLDEAEAEVVACGVFRDVRPLNGLAGLVDWRLAGRLSKLAKQGFLAGDVGEVVFVPARPRLRFDKLLVFGLRPRPAFDAATFRTVLARVLDALAGLQVKSALLELPGRGASAIEPETAAEALLEALGAERRDALSFVEGAAAQARIQAAASEHRASLRAQRGSAP